MKQRGKIGEPGVAKFAGSAIHHQHAALASLGGRLLRNQFLGQVEIEIRNAQIGAGVRAGHRGTWPK